MLAVYRDKLNPILPDERNDQLSGNYECFFVCQSDRLPSFNGRDGRLQSGETNE